MMPLDLSLVREAKSIDESINQLVIALKQRADQVRVPSEVKELVSELDTQEGEIVQAVKANLPDPSKDRQPLSQPARSNSGPDYVPRSGMVNTVNQTGRDPVSGLPTSRITETIPGQPHVNPYNGKVSEPEVLRAGPNGELETQEQYRARIESAARNVATGTGVPEKLTSDNHPGNNVSNPTLSAEANDNDLRSPAQNNSPEWKAFQARQLGKEMEAKAQEQLSRNSTQNSSQQTVQSEQNTSGQVPQPVAEASVQNNQVQQSDNGQ